MTLQETDPDLPVSVQESLMEAWVDGGLLQGRGTEWGSMCMAPFEGGRHYLHYLHQSLASGQTIGRKHSPSHHQKIGLKIQSHHSMGNRWGNSGNSVRVYFLGLQNHCRW